MTLAIFEKYPSYQAVIGIEVHVQLNTKTKIFCSCKNEISSSPNTNIDVICCGYPGTLPVLNEEVVNYAIMAGIATNCTINEHNEFARKHYFYADLPKGYQITQADKPICSNGYVEIITEDGLKKKIRIERIHMEEDAGKNIHAGNNVSLVDYNRAGTPLLEIVTKPDIASSFEARAYLKELHAIVTSIGICSGNMEEGAFRGDANVSVKKKDAEKLGTKCELKNINSFKFIGDAVDFEIERQIEALESGQKIKQQTRLWDTKNKETFVMREKEIADDYRYIPDPDLPPLHITKEKIEECKKNLPELPQAKKQRFMEVLQLSEYDANVIVDNKELCVYFEQIVKKNSDISTKLISNWLLRDINALVKEHNILFAELKFTPDHFVDLLLLIKIFDDLCIQVYILFFLI